VCQIARFIEKGAFYCFSAADLFWDFAQIHFRFVRATADATAIRHLDYLQGSESMLSHTPDRQHGTLCHMNSTLNILKSKLKSLF